MQNSAAAMGTVMAVAAETAITVKISEIPLCFSNGTVYNESRSGAVMKRIGMNYCYSYQEQWQPKDFPVIFRMYQLNFDGQKNRVYQKYWNLYDAHFIETDIYTADRITSSYSPGLLTCFPADIPVFRVRKGHGLGYILDHGRNVRLCSETAESCPAIAVGITAITGRAADT